MEKTFISERITSIILFNENLIWWIEFPHKLTQEIIFLILPNNEDNVEGIWLAEVVQLYIRFLVCIFRSTYLYSFVESCSWQIAFVTGKICHNLCVCSKWRLTLEAHVKCWDNVQLANSNIILLPLPFHTCC